MKEKSNVFQRLRYGRPECVDVGARKSSGDHGPLGLGTKRKKSGPWPAGSEDNHRLNEIAIKFATSGPTGQKNQWKSSEFVIKIPSERPRGAKKFKEK